jgi:curved DNA-binding protein CbpA
MNYQKAIDILEIDINNVDFKSSSTTYLKRCYHKQALKYHPDKNGNTTESTERFKLINDAYDFLKREDNLLYNDNLKETDENSSVYKDILQLFLKGILDGKYSESISSIIKEIILNFSEVKKMSSLKMFDGLDKETTINIYNFLSKYRSLFHFSNEFLDKIKDIIIKKHDDIMVYVLNPSIDDLLNNNVYKLYVEEELYLVPLWHSEMYFDVKKRETEPNELKETHDIKEIIVLCYPELPENITIDEDNNLYIEVNLNVSDISPFLSSSKNMKVFLGKKELDIPLYNLYIRDTQLYRIKSQGLTKIKENDIYDISEKCDIIVKINMTL